MMETITKAILNKIFKEGLKNDDPFDIHGGIPKIGEIRGTNGAEVAADEIVSKLREAGVDPKDINYDRIVNDIEKRVLKDGEPLEKIKDSVFRAEKKRIEVQNTDPIPPRGDALPNKGDEPSQETPPTPSSLGTGDDVEDPENASPENKKFINDLMQPGDAVDDIMLKKPKDLTEGEFMELKKRIIALPAGAEQDRLDNAAMKFLEHRFGSGPSKTDAVGRIIDAKPVRTEPDAPKPLGTADGTPLEAGLKRIGRVLLRDANSGGLADAIKSLQGGISILAETKLKQDGVFGPKTRSGLRQTLATLGQSKIREGMGLSRFNDFARQGQKKGFANLGEATEKSIAPLFRDPGKPTIRRADKIEAVTLQETLNDLGPKQTGGDFKPLKLDGDIGRKTTDAFNQMTNAIGPEAITKRFGEFLGFF